MPFGVPKWKSAQWSFSFRNQSVQKMHTVYQQGRKRVVPDRLSIGYGFLLLLRRCLATTYLTESFAVTVVTVRHPYILHSIVSRHNQHIFLNIWTRQALRGERLLRMKWKNRSGCPQRVAAPQQHPELHTVVRESRFFFPYSNSAKRTVVSKLAYFRLA